MIATYDDNNINDQFIIFFSSARRHVRRMLFWTYSKCMRFRLRYTKHIIFLPFWFVSMQDCFENCIKRTRAVFWLNFRTNYTVRSRHAKHNRWIIRASHARTHRTFFWKNEEEEKRARCNFNFCHFEHLNWVDKMMMITPKNSRNYDRLRLALSMAHSQL